MSECRAHLLYSEDSPNYAGLNCSSQSVLLDWQDPWMMKGVAQAIELWKAWKCAKNGTLQKIDTFNTV